MNIAIMSISIYTIFSLLFFIFKLFVKDIGIGNKNNDILNPPYEQWRWLIPYFVLSFVVIGGQNLYFSTMDGCSSQFAIISIYTILPLFLIMGTTMIFLVIMNWNRIFANTFGLWLVDKIKLDGNSPEFFYNDPNILLQELEPDILFNLGELNNTLDKLGLTKNINSSQHEIIKNQYYVKQNIGYFTWLTFTGIVASLVSANSILLQDCVIE